MRDILEDLTRMKPLVLQQEPTWQQNNLTSGVYYMLTPGRSFWVCTFCGCRDDAEVDAYGHVRVYGGDFPHADSCVWQRAKELVDG